VTGTGESSGELWSSRDDFETRWSGTDWKLGWIYEI